VRTQRVERARGLVEPRPGLRNRARHIERVHPAAQDAAEAGRQHRLQGAAEPYVVRARDEMEGPAHQRAPHDLLPFDRPHEGLPLELVEPRPEPDERRTCRLRLKAGKSLHRRGWLHRLAAQEHLPGERSPVQRAAGQRRVRHGGIAPHVRRHQP
jgi:hypothetical protein